MHQLPPDYTYRLIKQNAQFMAKEHAQLREAAAVRGAHSRAAVLARFLQRLADRVDPTGEARRTI
jgi:hypothetical protein